MIGLIASGLFLVFPSIPGADLSLFQKLNRELGALCQEPPAQAISVCRLHARLVTAESALVRHHTTGNPGSTSTEGGLVPVGVAACMNNQCFSLQVSCAEPWRHHAGNGLAVVIHH